MMELPWAEPYKIKMTEEILRIDSRGARRMDKRSQV